MRRLLAITLAILVLVLGVGTPAARPPDAAVTEPAPQLAETRLREWLGAFNSQDEARYGAYIRANAPDLAKYIKDDHRYAVFLGGLRLKRIVSATRTQAEAELTDPYSDAITRLTIKVRDKAPHEITAVDFAPPQVDFGAIRQFGSDAQLAKELDARLHAQAADKRFSGVVMVSRDGRTLFARGYGDFKQLWQRCKPHEVRFFSASLGKMLTATAVMQLVQQDKIELDAPVSRYVHELSGRLADATVRQLLNHTAGAGDFMTEEVRARSSSLSTLRDITAILKSRDPEFTPGSKWKYANYGYVLLGRAVEHASGVDYFGYLKQHVVPGLNLGLGKSALACTTIATLQTRGPDGIQWVDGAPALEVLPTSAGAAPLTAGQLTTFSQDLLNGKLLAPGFVEKLFAGTVEIPNGKYALGFKDLRRNGLRYVGHGGSAPGTNHEVDIYPNSGYVVVVLTNQDPPYGNRAADFIGNRMGKLAAADRASDATARSSAPGN